MTFIDIAAGRYSVRNYKNVPVEKEKILKVLEAGRLAPSAVNYQPLHFIVITDGNVKNKVLEVYSRDWIRKAPVLIVVCGDHSQSWKRKDGKDHCDIDAAISADHITLAAADMGLGTCWVCAFDAEKCHKVLDLPENLEAIALLPMGYPSQENYQPEKKRKSLSEIVSWDRYGG
jgi:nitroreductase